MKRKKIKESKARSKSPTAQPTWINGLDVSSSQGIIDWKSVTTDSKQFAFAFAKATEGGDFVDDQFANNRAGMKVAGFKTSGIYHFFKPKRPVADQIKNFVDTVGKLEPGETPVLDLEGSSKQWAGMPKVDRVPKALEWLRGVEAALGVRPIIYTGPGFVDGVLGANNAMPLGAYDLWVAHYKTAAPTVPDAWKSRGWKYWQWTDAGRSVGISAAVDLNHLNPAFAAATASSPPAIASAPATSLSGIDWVAKFPTSTDVADLLPPFRDNVIAFLSALASASAGVTISATYRPKERAFLMHYAWAIARLGLSPAAVPQMTGVDIDWVHVGTNGKPDLVASRKAAQDMVTGYGIAFQPALVSQHTARLAIDMTISWSGTLSLKDALGKNIAISTTPRNGLNRLLISTGQTYGVIKLLSDPPHWSVDGQ